MGRTLKFAKNHIFKLYPTKNGIQIKTSSSKPSPKFLEIINSIKNKLLKKSKHISEKLNWILYVCYNRIHSKNDILKTHGTIINIIMLIYWNGIGKKREENIIIWKWNSKQNYCFVFSVLLWFKFEKKNFP